MTIDPKDFVRILTFQQRTALSDFVLIQPDSLLPPYIDAMIPELRGLRLVRTCKCSDGDYAEITDLGRLVAAELAKEADDGR